MHTLNEVKKNILIINEETVMKEIYVSFRNEKQKIQNKNWLENLIV